MISIKTSCTCPFSARLMSLSRRTIDLTDTIDFAGEVPRCRRQGLPFAIMLSMPLYCHLGEKRGHNASVFRLGSIACW